jgi:hypothetical protein
MSVSIKGGAAALAAAALVAAQLAASPALAQLAARDPALFADPASQAARAVVYDYPQGYVGYLCAVPQPCYDAFGRIASYRNVVVPC